MAKPRDRMGLLELKRYAFPGERERDYILAECGLLTSKQARRVAKKLVEMADWIDAKPKKKTRAPGGGGGGG